MGVGGGLSREGVNVFESALMSLNVLNVVIVVVNPALDVLSFRPRCGLRTAQQASLDSSDLKGQNAELENENGNSIIK